MATKSILKDITIRDKKTCKRFIEAMEKAEKEACKKDVEISKSCNEIKGENILDFFG